MDRKLRKRIVGAVVLGAFMVILVPEWLDGAGHKSRYSNRVDIPESPQFKPITDYVAKNTPATPHASPQPVVTVNKAIANKVKANKVTANKIKANKPIQMEAPSVRAWTLQLGSFSKEANAESMRDKLRNKGYASYVDVLKKSNRTAYRVRIGPELNKSRLEKLRLDVIKKEKLTGLILQHP